MDLQTITAANRLNLTDRENALLMLCLANGLEREAALAICRTALGPAMITDPQERAKVAHEVALRGFDGLGRVELATREIEEAVARM